MSHLSRSVFRQYLAAIVAGLSIFLSGAAYAWINPLLDRLEKPGSEIPLTPDQGGWAVSLIEIGNLVAPLPTGALIDYCGRKLALWISGPILLATWIVVLSVRSVTVLFVVRFVQGIAMSVQFTVLPLYLAEIGSKEHRGALTSLFQMMWYFGIFCEYVAGSFLGFDGLTWFSLVPCLVFIVLFLFCPETPYCLVMKGKSEEAGKSLAWLRACDTDDPSIKEELRTMVASYEEEKAQKGSWKDIFATREGRKALIIVLIIGFTEIMSGLFAILAYCTQTFTRATGDAKLASDATLAMGGILVLVNVFEIFLIERYGRRPLLLISAFGGSVSVIVTAVYYILDEITDVNMKPYAWIIFVSISGIAFFISFGCGALLPVVMSEYFPSSTRGVASGLIILLITISSTVCLKMYQVIEDNYGLYLIYSIFAVFSTVGSFLIYWLVPETKGLSFDEIQRVL